MKKAILSITVISIIAIITVLSCKKTNNPSTSTTAASLNQLFSGLRYTPQNLSVTAGRDTVVYGANGTMLHFYTNSFQNGSGTIITSGTVNLQLIEMYKAGDMICNRATTTANGQILQSGGQITMVATLSNGQEVFANKYGIGFKHSNPSSATMALFYGATGNTDSVTTWTQSDSTQKGATANGTGTDSLSLAPLANFFFFDTCTSFTWANCDWFYASDSPKTSVSVILPDTSFNAANTQVYLVLPNVNRWGNAADTFTAVLGETGYGGYTYSAATNTLSLLSGGNSAIVPSGLNYELVVITNKNGSYYYYEHSGTIPGNGLIATVTPTPETQGDIVARLQGL